MSTTEIDLLVSEATDKMLTILENSGLPYTIQFSTVACLLEIFIKHSIAHHQLDMETVDTIFEVIKKQILVSQEKANGQTDQ